MRLSDRSISTIKEASVTQVVQHYVQLKRAGSDMKGCCPFHGEKTPSFSVSEVKGMYKCFGCGVGGDAIRFVMEHEKLSFIEACKTIAEICGIQLEWEETEQTEEQKKVLSAADAQEEVLNYIVPVYRKSLFQLPEEHPAKQFLYNRGINDEVIAEWQLGWAPEEWQFSSSQLIEKGWWEPSHKLGLIRRKDDHNYDGYRSRIIIPIVDRSGRYLGLGGRLVVVDKNDKVKGFAKYINPAACELYDKSTVLFGLNRSRKAIADAKAVYVVEGYFDAISLIAQGIENVVATSGTAFTAGQMKTLKKLADRVVLFMDNDEAGAHSKAAALAPLLRHGFTVEHVNYQAMGFRFITKKMIEEGAEISDTVKDADELCHRLQKEGRDLEGELKKSRQDFLIHRAGEIMEEAADDLLKKSTAKQIVLELVAAIPNEILRANYLDTVIKKYSWTKGETKQQFARMMESAEEVVQEEDTSMEQLPSWLSMDEKEQYFKSGYLPINRKLNGRPMVGYYSFTGGNKTEITNFIVNPLFHVYAGVESRFLLQIYNGYRHAVLDIPAKAIPSIDQFQANTVAEGNYIIFGAKPQWLRIASDLLQNFPRCVEIKSLGWQSYKFFAYVDKVFIPGQGLRELDQWGIIKVEEENFLIPASCEAYKQLQHTGDDPFENDRHLTYKLSPVSFEQWAGQMQRVYNQAGVVGVAAVFLSLFRDIVFAIDNNCPHLYAFGEPSSGKSKWAESITALFFFRRPAFNLNSGTDFAFFSFMQKYRNTPAHLNEFDIEVIKPEWFQAIKGIYDGEGRERGKGGSKNRTEVMKVLSVLVLTGQKLVTADDNSVVTRSLIEPFSVRENLSEEDKQAYNDLKDWEGAGLSSLLIEVLQHRPYMEEVYKTEFNDLLSNWRKLFPESRSYNQRILQNYAHLATGYLLMSRKLKLPQSADDFTAYCFKQAGRWSAFIRSSDTLSEFWRTLEFLVDQQDVQEGWDYSIELVNELRIRRNRTEEEVLRFDEPLKVLFLRLNNVHKLFQSAYRSRTGKEAMNEQNLLHYFSSRRYFLGPVKSKNFKRYVNHVKEMGPHNMPVTEKKLQMTKSSCYAFLYEELDLSIERMDGTEDPGNLPLFTTTTESAVPDDLTF